MNENKQRGRVYLTTIHHSDLTWQYPYEEYDRIREKQLNIVMRFFREHPDYGFVIDQAYVLQNYLQRNPERLEEIKKYFNHGNGSLELIGGYSIQDMNIPNGETFLRNCMLARAYYEREFNHTPDTASLMDSFGVPFQTPQMLSVLGYRYLAPGRMPNAPEELDIDQPFVWQGAADTAVTVVPQGGAIDSTSYVTNVPILRTEQERFDETIRNLQNAEGNVLAYYMTEFTMMNPDFFRHLEEANSDPNAPRVETTPESLPAGVPAQRDGTRCFFLAQLPAYSIQAFPKAGPDAAAEPQLLSVDGYRGETDCFRFDFTSAMPKITSKRFPKNVFGQDRFGELLLRHDNGSMWHELIQEVPYGAEYQQETVCSVEEGPLFIKVTTEGSVLPGKKPISGNLGDYWPGFGSLSFRKEYLFPRTLPYFRLRLTLNFTGNNTKISMRIPVELDPLKAKALYHTPFAATERKPYFEVPYQYRDTAQTLRPGDYSTAKGDFPAVHWVDYCDNEIGLSVGNSGTPGHQLVGKEIQISLLRSGTSLQGGTMYPQPGAYDNGEHIYEFTFSDHAAGDTAAAIATGEILNRAPVCIANSAEANYQSLLSFAQDNIVVSAVYRKNENLILRAYECLGQETQSVLQCGTMDCYASDAYGKVSEKLDKDCVRFKPFEIRTFVLKE